METIKRTNTGWKFTVPCKGEFTKTDRNGVPCWSLPAEVYYGVVLFEESLFNAMKEGDRLEWWYSDTSCLPDIYLAGELTKTGGVKLHLTGHMDAGARTGRPPVLRLKKR